MGQTLLELARSGEYHKMDSTEWRAFIGETGNCWLNRFEIDKCDIKFWHECFRDGMPSNMIYLAMSDKYSQYESVSAKTCERAWRRVVDK